MSLTAAIDRVHICHTWYHAYLACVKELIARDGRADLILSTMSNDFGDLKERLAGRGIFEHIYMFDETTGEDDAELQALHRDRGNLFLNLIQRIKYTRRLGKLQEGRVPVDLSRYLDVYVFCDSDPIGYYLNYKKIRYHAVEDGLNSGKLDNQARLSNMGAWGLKKFMAKLGLIFIECGYSRYCIDYEVNDISANFDPPGNTVEVPRDRLYAKLTEGDHRILADVFLPDAKSFRERFAGGEKPVAMILTEPLCDYETRERLFADVTERYIADYDVVIKPHPRDVLDYGSLFAKKYPDVYVLKGRFPMEVLRDLEGFRIAKLVSVITQVDGMDFAESTDYLGLDFLDKYEDPAVHRKMEKLAGKAGVENRALPPGDKYSAEASGKASGEEYGLPATGGALTARRATEDDCEWWLELRNDETVRENSGNTEIIDEETHSKWFSAKLADPDERLYVFLREGRRAGQLRLSKTEDGILISYAVCVGDRGTGLGTEMIKRASELAAHDFAGSGDMTLVAGVRAHNRASARIFEKCGYVRSVSENGDMTFKKPVAGHGGGQ